MFCVMIVGWSRYMKGGDAKKEDTVEHFYEKLLHLRGMMKTEAGRAIAEVSTVQ